VENTYDDSPRSHWRVQSVRHQRILDLSGEMIRADGEVQESELAILNEYLHKRVQQIDEMAGYAKIDDLGG